jgi:hypothetical protein
MVSPFRAVVPLTVLALLCTACSEFADPHDATQDPLRPDPIINGRPTGSAFGNVGALLFDFTGDGSDHR